MLSLIKNQYDTTGIDNRSESLQVESSLITKLCGITNLPPEIIFEIGVRLHSSEDVANLRNSHNHFSTSIESFEEMQDKLNNPRIQKDLKQFFYRTLLDKKVRDLLQGSKDDTDIMKRALIEALNNVVVVSNAKETIVSTTFSAGVFRGRAQNKVDEIFTKFREIMKPKLCWGGSSNTSNVSDSIKLWKSTTHYNHTTIDSTTVKEIFAKAQNLYDKNEDNEKLIIAVIAAELGGHWFQNPPNEISKDDIHTILLDFAELFIIGKKAKQIASEI